MKSEYWQIYTQESRRFYCNEWECTCNDGVTGCYANEYFMLLCEDDTMYQLERSNNEQRHKRSQGQVRTDK